MDGMKRTTVTMLAITLTGAIAATLVTGCSRMAPKPTKQIQVPGGGPPVFTSLEMERQSPATPPGAAADALPPGMVAQASYARPLSNGNTSNGNTANGRTSSGPMSTV